ncbi:MAG: hypothetical protein R3D88_03220 [Alphaproteobacteria bacterium]|nr:hypothetical protein [Alphaproteobacteria bacterium]
MQTYKLIFVIFLTLNLQACASSNAAKTAQGSGLTKTYAASYDATWNASINAVNATYGEVVEENKEEGNIVATYGVTPFSWGERVAVFLKSLGSKETEVEVVSKRAVSTNITAANWEPKIHDKISEELSSK